MCLSQGSWRWSKCQQQYAHTGRTVWADQKLQVHPPQQALPSWESGTRWVLNITTPEKQVLLATLCFKLHLAIEEYLQNVINYPVYSNTRWVCTGLATWLDCNDISTRMKPVALWFIACPLLLTKVEKMTLSFCELDSEMGYKNRASV